MFATSHKRYASILLFLLLLASHYGYAQQKTIVIIKDSEAPFLVQLEEQLKEELNKVLVARYELNYISFSGTDNQELIAKIINEVYAEKEANLVIGLGFISSGILHRFNTYPIPTIATMVFDATQEKDPRISNYSYATPYQSFNEVLSYFTKMYTLERVGVLGDPPFLDANTDAFKNIQTSIQKLDINTVDFPTDVDGIIILPQLFQRDETIRTFIDNANQQAIPTLSISEEYLKYNCTVGIDAGTIISPLVKQTAVHSLAFLEGDNSAKFMLQQSSESFNVILNMEGVRMIQKLPNWDYLENSMLINVDKLHNATPLSLAQAIAIGLREKISLKKSALYVKQTEQDIKRAKGNLSPKLSFGVEGVLLSDNVVQASLGQKGARTISGNLSLQQIIYSEPTLANIALTTLLKERTTEENRQEILDAVVSVTQAYLSVLLSKADLRLQNENLNQTKANLTVARSKERLGLSSQSDVNRWLSELNMNKIQLNTAQANYKEALYTLNETLNQPIATPYELPNDIDLQTVFSFPQDLLVPFLEDEFLLEKVADFYLDEMKANAPELNQVSLSEQIIDRRIISNQRKFFLPEVVGFAGMNDILSLQGVSSNPQFTVPPPPLDLTWNAGVKLNFPILDRKARTTNLAKARLDKEFLNYSRAEIENTLERSIMSSIQQFKSSFISYHYSNNASKAADDNYSQAEEAYQQGFISVTQLLEAQTAKFRANLLVFQTNYKMVLDYLLLERLSGKIQLLDTAQEQEEHLLKLQQFLLK